jgi:hypothetical protein
MVTAARDTARLTASSMLAVEVPMSSIVFSTMASPPDARTLCEAVERVNRPRRVGDMCGVGELTVSLPLLHDSLCEVRIDPGALCRSERDSDPSDPNRPEQDAGGGPYGTDAMVDQVRTGTG